MRTFSLQSGSNGNAIYVEAGGVRLLFDAGISGRQAQARMAARGRDIRDVDALIISHDHRDHVRCAGIYQRKFGLPIYVTRRTLAAVQKRDDLGPLHDVRFFRAGDVLRFGAVTVHTLPTAHDAADGVAFVVEHEGRRLAILTDLGSPAPWMRQVLEEAHGAYLESNYDPYLLEIGPYPWPVKERIRGKGGHLSNPEAATLLQATRRKPAWIAVAHLSEENNEPELAFEAHHDRVGRTYPVRLASRWDVSDEWEV